jgi:hypothetical protein
MTKQRMITSVIACVAFLLGMIAGAFVQTLNAAEPYQVVASAKTVNFVRDRGIELHIISSATYRAVVTNRLARTDFIGSIKNLGTQPIQSVGVEVYVFDTGDNKEELMWEYVGMEIMWIDMVVGPGESKQFKQSVEYDLTLDVPGKPMYSFGILGVVK